MHLCLSLLSNQTVNLVKERTLLYMLLHPQHIQQMNEQTSSEENIAISKFRMHIPCNYPLGIIYSCAHVQNREYTRLFAVALVCNSERGKQTEVNF